MNQNLSIRSRGRSVVHLHSLLALAALAACGGGGSGTAVPASLACQTNCVSGIAASGKPISSAAVTLADSVGTTRSATTATDGSYQIDSSGLVAPYLLKVVAGNGATYYSVSTDANPKTTVNLTQLSDLIVRTWYGAQGVDAGTAFGATAANPAPTAAALPTLAAGVQSMVQIWLDKNNVPSSFNLISTPFAANGSGIDAVLDATRVAVASPAAATVTITGGTLTQSTSLAMGAGSVTTSSTTTDSATGTTSSSVTTSAVPTAPGSTTALDALKTLLGAVATAVNTKGANLVAADLLPFVDPNLLDDGRNATQFIASFVGNVAGSTIAFQILNVASLDPAADRAELKLLFTQSANGQSGTESLSLPFKRINGNWLITGNRRAYRFDAQAEMRTDQGANTGWNRCDGSPSGPGMSINVHVSAVAGQFSSGNVSGGGAVWPNNKNTPTQCVTTSALAPGPTAVENGLSFDTFLLNTGPIAAASRPAAGSPITASMTLAVSGAAIPATVALNAWTSDPVTITAPTNSALASIVFGAQTPVSWALPSTYAVQNVKLHVIVFTGPSDNPATKQCSGTEASLAKNATSGSVVIASTCAGLPVVQANLNLGVNGVNGERSESIFTIK